MMFPIAFRKIVRLSKKCSRMHKFVQLLSKQEALGSTHGGGNDQERDTRGG